MKLSVNWLRELVDLPDPVSVTFEALSHASLADVPDRHDSVLPGRCQVATVEEGNSDVGPTPAGF